MRIRLAGLPAIALLLAACGGSAPDGAPTARDQQLLSTTADLLGAWDQNNQELMRASLTSDFVRVGNGVVEARGPDEYLGMMTLFHTAMPDFDITAEDTFVRDNKTYFKWTASGTNTGMFGANAPTGKSSVTHGFTILTFNDEGKVTREEVFVDHLGYQLAWGYTITPPPAQ